MMQTTEEGPTRGKDECKANVVLRLILLNIRWNGHILVLRVSTDLALIPLLATGNI